MAENKQLSTTRVNRPQIKVCGLTRVAEAQACVDAGVDAIGLVFYPPSPRFVRPERAARIAAAVSGQAATVGVFVDETYDTIMRSAEDCFLQVKPMTRLCAAPRTAFSRRSSCTGRNLRPWSGA